MFDTSPENLELKRRKSSLVESLKEIQILVRASNQSQIDILKPKIEKLLEECRELFQN